MWCTNWPCLVHLPPNAKLFSRQNEAVPGPRGIESRVAAEEDRYWRGALSTIVATMKAGEPKQKHRLAEILWDLLPEKRKQALRIAARVMEQRWRRKGRTPSS